MSQCLAKGRNSSGANDVYAWPRHPHHPPPVKAATLSQRQEVAQCNFKQANDVLRRYPVWFQGMGRG